MKFDSAQTIVSAFLFLLPGFVWSAVYAALIPRKTDSEQIRFMEFFTLSSLNNAFWSPVVYLAYRGRFYERHAAVAAVLVFAVVFLSPLAAALITAFFRRKGWIARFIDWLGFQTARRNTTAWDFKLSPTEPAWVNVQLQDGDRILGWFGASSFAGDSGSTADLYLERTLTMDANGEEFSNAGNHGIWIASDQIATIDFIGDANGA